MRITFLIGNGFDVGCGLKSRYIDTYDEYISVKPTSSNLKKFKRDLDGDYDTWSDFELGMAEYARNFNSEDDFVECIRDYSLFLHHHLVKEEENYKSELTKMSAYKRNAILDRMEESIYEFYSGTTNSLEKYIVKLINNETKVNFSFINFNYTIVFDLLLEMMKERMKKNKKNLYYDFNAGIHIHGRLNNDMVLGVDSEEQLKDIPFKLTDNGKRAFIKPFFNQIFDDDRVEQTRDIIRNSDIICVFGMTLGDSDLTWRTELIDWLKSDKEHHMFFYDIGLMITKGNLAFDRLQKSENKVKELACRLSLDYDLVKDKIHIPVGKLFFNPSTVTYPVYATVPHPPSGGY